jgi:hypothetical protein
VEIWIVRGRNIVVGIIIGIILGSSGMYYLLVHTPILEIGLLGPAVESSNQMPVEELSAADQKPTLATNDLKYTVLDVRKSDFGVKGEKPLEGGIFVISKIQIENIGKTEVMVFGNSWFVQDSEGRIFKPKTFDATAEEDEKLFSIQIPPGFKIVKDIGFEIPAQLKLPLQLYVADKSSTGDPILLGRII